MFLGILSSNNNKAYLAPAILLIIAIALLLIKLLVNTEPSAEPSAEPPAEPSAELGPMSSSAVTETQLPASQTQMLGNSDILSPDFIATRGSHCEKYYLIYKQEPSQHNEVLARQVCRNFN
ncbi:hypothetical protein [Pseudoalteromonas sp. T1lg48]|uniref:hypothetical protein n=1 Tax=Pseudoalteromonas sp. T1lg48 TaxID=2077100 RepID=UPI000CF6B97B|nr:hypothetical protein [Pseudoalteromonas sp. T1lg48]